MSKLVTVYTSMSLPEIYMIKGKLESEGVMSFTKDELITQTAPYISSLTNGISLQVQEEDVVKAVEVIQEAGYLKPSVSKDKFSLKVSVIFIAVLVVLLVYILVSRGII